MHMASHQTGLPLALVLQPHLQECHLLIADAKYEVVTTEPMGIIWLTLSSSASSATEAVVLAPDPLFSAVALWSTCRLAETDLPNDDHRLAHDLACHLAGPYLAVHENNWCLFDLETHLVRSVSYLDLE